MVFIKVVLIRSFSIRRVSCTRFVILSVVSGRCRARVVRSDPFRGEIDQVTGEQDDVAKPVPATPELADQAAGQDPERATTDIATPVCAWARDR